ASRMRHTTRVSSSGKTRASQARNEGSIPFTRSLRRQDFSPVERQRNGGVARRAEGARTAGAQDTRPQPPSGRPQDFSPVERQRNGGVARRAEGARTAGAQDTRPQPPSGKLRTRARSPSPLHLPPPPAAVPTPTSAGALIQTT